MFIYRIVMYKNNKIVDFKKKNMKLYEDFIFDVDDFRFFYIKRNEELINDNNLVNELLKLKISEYNVGSEVKMWNDFLSYMFKENYENFDGNDYVNVSCGFYGKYDKEDNVFYLNLDFYVMDGEEDEEEKFEYYDKVMEEFFVNRKWKFFVDECIE